MTKRSAIDQIEFMRNLLAFLLVGTFVSTIPLFVFKIIPKANEQVVTYMVGQLSGMALTVLGFYFVNKVGQDAIDAKRTENTGKALDAIAAVAGTETPKDAKQAAEQVAGAAEDEKDKITGGKT